MLFPGIVCNMSLWIVPEVSVLSFDGFPILIMFPKGRHPGFDTGLDSVSCENGARNCFFSYLFKKLLFRSWHCPLKTLFSKLYGAYKYAEAGRVFESEKHYQRFDFRHQSCRSLFSRPRKPNTEHIDRFDQGRLDCSLSDTINLLRSGSKRGWG